MSMQFRESWYLTNNPDVFLAVTSGAIPSGLFHYNQFGWKEGRDPNPNFDTSYYLAQNPDVADALLAGAFASPLDHFLKFGAAEGRAPSEAVAELLPYFDADTYLAANPDVADAVAAGAFTALEHWQLYGQFEGRDGGPVLPPVGQVFELTPGTDSGPAFTGGDADDVFNAQLQQTGLLPIQTLNNSDDIDGGGGRNTLNAQLANLFTIPAGLNNIQVLNLEGNPGLLGILPLPTVLDVVNANAIEEINFRTPTNGVEVYSLQTALNTVGIYDDGIMFGGGGAGNEFFISHIGDATDGDSDSLEINIRNLQNGTTLRLQHVDGGADQGYENILINSMGPLNNIFTLVSDHGPDTIQVVGNNDLVLDGNALDVGTLDELDASTFTGDLSADFFGTGNVVVYGGSGDDDLWFGIEGDVEVYGNAGDDWMGFGADANATAFGGEGDDRFFFESDGGQTSFDEDDYVDGGDGEDRLILQVSGGSGPEELLVDGVGDNIVNVGRIIHTGTNVGGNMLDDLTVNWARSGSATMLILAAEDYNGNDVTVTNLTNDDMVIVVGNGIDDLTLGYAAPSATNIINLYIGNDSPTIGVTISDLYTQLGTELLNITSFGGTLNEVQDVSAVNGNVQLFGDTDLIFGGPGTQGNVSGESYNVNNGTIDASGASGDITVFLGTGHQTYIDGSGDNTIWTMTQGTAHTNAIYLGDGANTVGFAARSVAPSNRSLDPDDQGMTFVYGFNGDDTVVLNLQTNISPLTNADDDAVSEGDPLVPRNVEIGDIIDLDGTNINFLRFETAVTGATTVQGLFEAAIGDGEIGVDFGADMLAAAFDDDQGMMVLFRIDNGNATIDDNDTAQAIAAFEMSYDDFLAFNNVEFLDNVWA